MFIHVIHTETILLRMVPSNLGRQQLAQPARLRMNLCCLRSDSLLNKYGPILCSEAMMDP